MKIIISTLLLIGLAMNVNAQKDAWKAFEIKDLSDKRESTGNPYLKFLDEKTMSMGLYVLPVGTVDKQQPHKLDEAYFIIEGKAVLKVEEDDVPVKPGSTVFVKANVAHSFIKIDEDLKILVFFSTAEIK